jgi:hypothetical protein
VYQQKVQELEDAISVIRDLEEKNEQGKNNERQLKLNID